MNVLDLFSGLAGFSLGFHKAGMKTVGFCEKDEFCRKVIARHNPGIPIFEDIKDVTKERVRESCGTIDVVSAGFP